MTTQTDLSQLSAVASRIREMREIMGWTPEEDRGFSGGIPAV